MSKITESHKIILDSIKSIPKTALDINVNIDRSVKYEHLQRAVKNKEAVFFGRDNNKLKNYRTEQFVKTINDPIWPRGKPKIFLGTELSSKLLKSLKRKYSKSNKNDDIIEEICFYYQIIEVTSKHWKFELTNPELIKKILKNKNKSSSDSDIETEINKNIKNINNFYKNRKRILKLSLIKDNKEDISKEFNSFFYNNFFIKKNDPIIVWMFFSFLKNIDPVKNEQTNEFKEGIGKIFMDKVKLLFINLYRKNI
ncbi:MAG: hypothetical protein ACP5OG_01655 [Candidatus Nanoarchaeia archaeon]